MLISKLKQARRQRGDTIIEVLLSVSILGLVLAMSFTSSSRSLNAGTDAANRNQALAYAQEQVELLRTAANNGSIKNFPTNGNAFCIDPATGAQTTVGSDGLCHINGESIFGVAVKYNSSNQSYNVSSAWAGVNEQNQVNLYYQTPNNPITAVPTVSLSLSAAPAVIGYGDSTTISWSVNNAASCQASNAWTGSKSVDPGTHTESFNNLKTTQTYTMTCQSKTDSSSITKSAKVFVSQLPKPVINFTATPQSIAYNGSSTLNWAVTNAVTCTASGAWSGPKGLSGSQSTGTLTASQTYTLKCVGSDGVSASTTNVTVTVAPPPNPSLSFYASPNSICYGCGATLYWSTSNAFSCWASGAWSGWVSTSGSSWTGGLGSSRTYYLTCYGYSGTTPASGSATVYVAPPPPPPPPPRPNCTASAGGSRNGNLVWISGGGSGCQWYYDSIVGWNGGGTWGPINSSSQVCHTQNGGSDPWGTISSASWCG